MINITNAVVDVADCNITFGALGAARPPAMLQFADGAAYNAFYRRVADERPSFDELSGNEESILAQLAPVYSDNKYWRRYFSSGATADYPDIAWESFLPIAAKLNDWINVALPEELDDLNVSPMPTVLLYPFGWCTWVSFLITGDYGLEDLATLVRHLVTQRAYSIDADSIDFAGVCDYISQGMRKEAYGKAVARNPQDFLTVTTVLAKSGGSPSLGALNDEQARALRTLIRPSGPQLQLPFRSMASALPYGGSPDLDYVLHHGMSWFVWADHLLWPEARNQRNLRCYHNNTFRSVLQAWLLANLLTHAASTKPWSPAVADLVERAVINVDAARAAGEYRNLSARSYLSRPELAPTVAAAKKRLAPATP